MPCPRCKHPVDLHYLDKKKREGWVGPCRSCGPFDPKRCEGAPIVVGLGEAFDHAVKKIEKSQPTDRPVPGKVYSLTGPRSISAGDTWQGSEVWCGGTKSDHSAYGCRAKADHEHVGPDHIRHMRGAAKQNGCTPDRCGLKAQKSWTQVGGSEHRHDESEGSHRHAGGATPHEHAVGACGSKSCQMPDAPHTDKPNWRRSGPQVYVDGWRGNAHRVLRHDGNCVGCGRRTYSFDDGENDPRGILGDHASSSESAEDYDYPKGLKDVPACFNCMNDEPQYRKVQKIAHARWGREVGSGKSVPDKLPKDITDMDKASTKHVWQKAAPIEPVAPAKVAPWARERAGVATHYKKERTNPAAVAQIKDARANGMGQLGKGFGSEDCPVCGDEMYSPEEMTEHRRSHDACKICGHERDNHIQGDHYTGTKTHCRDCRFERRQKMDDGDPTWQNLPDPFHSIQKSRAPDQYPPPFPDGFVTAVGRDTRICKGCGMPSGEHLVGCKGGGTEKVSDQVVKKAYTPRGDEVGMFRALTDEEEARFRKWARENPEAGNTIDKRVLHPVVHDEWAKVRSESAPEKLPDDIRDRGIEKAGVVFGTRPFARRALPKGQLTRERAGAPRYRKSLDCVCGDAIGSHLGEGGCANCQCAAFQKAQPVYLLRMRKAKCCDCGCAGCPCAHGKCKKCGCGRMNKSADDPNDLSGGMTREEAKEALRAGRRRVQFEGLGGKHSIEPHKSGNGKFVVRYVPRIKKSESVEVPEIPKCDFHPSAPAYADARLPSVGSWANVCKDCFHAHGASLGTGRGQVYMAEGRSKPQKSKSKMPPCPRCAAGDHGRDKREDGLRHTATMKTPSINTVMKWDFDGDGRATDGCKVESDGNCPHGHQSWIRRMGIL